MRKTSESISLMDICPSCGWKNDSTARTCPYCHSSLIASSHIGFVKTAEEQDFSLQVEYGEQYSNPSSMSTLGSVIGCILIACGILALCGCCVPEWRLISSLIAAILIIMGILMQLPKSSYTKQLKSAMQSEQMFGIVRSYEIEDNGNNAVKIRIVHPQHKIVIINLLPTADVFSINDKVRVRCFNRKYLIEPLFESNADFPVEAFAAFD